MSAPTFTLEDLEKTFVALRKHGVKTYADTAGGGFSVEFFPAESAPDEAKPSNDPEMCACKHSLPIQHVNGMCVEGCTPDECNPERKP